MRFNTFSYLIREGFRSLRQNFFMSAASVLVLVSCLLITGCAYLVYENVENAFDWAYQQNVVVAWAEKDVAESELPVIREKIEDIDEVAEVEVITKDELLDRYKDEYGTLLEDLKADNPLQHSFVIKFNDLEHFEKTVGKIEALTFMRGDGTNERLASAIEYVEYNQTLSETLIKVRNVALNVGVWVIGLLLVVSLFIISNTIKLTVYSRRLEISIMRSVGATRAFVRFPFVVEGLMLGIVAGTLAYGLLFGVYEVIRQNFTFSSTLALIPFVNVWWQVLVGFLAGGIVTGMLGSTVSIGRYLREHTE